MVRAIRAKVVSSKVAGVRANLEALESLPLAHQKAFFSDPGNPPAAETYLRRCLEALLHLGRHLASQGLGEVVLEYGLIGPTLAEKGVLPAPLGELLGLMGRYRNRLTHFYDDVRGEELRLLALEHRGDVLAVLEALVQWVREHPELVDSSL
jgi:uncharacterized protein YutE (UPF0331/DUF86 family)